MNLSGSILLRESLGTRAYLISGSSISDEKEATIKEVPVGKSPRLAFPGGLARLTDDSRAGSQAFYVQWDCWNLSLENESRV